MKRLEQIWKSIKSHLVNEPPPAEEPPIRRPPHGVEIGPGQEDEEFVLRLSDGTYYAGPGKAQGAIERAARIEDAARFPNRWAALQAASIGPIFTNAAIQAVRVHQWPTSIAARR